MNTNVDFEHAPESQQLLFDGKLRKNRATIKKNSVYVFIEKLIKEQDELIRKTNYQIVKLETDDKRAILFKIPVKPDYILFENEGFKYQERHLRVDYYYSVSGTIQGMPGFSAAHYTEYYWNDKTKETITVHLYYAKVGRYIQIKRHQGEKVDFLTENPYLSRLIHLNGYEALSFYDNLVLKKEVLYSELSKKVDVLEEEISMLSRNLKTAKQMTCFIEKLLMFCNAIEAANLLNEFEKDCRAEFTYKAIQFYQEQLLVLEAKEARIKTREASTAKSKARNRVKPTHETGNKVVQAKGKKPNTQSDDVTEEIRSVDKEIMTKLIELRQKFQEAMQNTDPNAMFQRYELAKEFNLFYLNYSFIPDNDFKQKLKEMDKAVDALPKAVKVAKEAARAGQLAVIEKLLILLSYTEQLELVTELFRRLLEPELNDNSQLAESLRSICEYCYENSPHYASIARIKSLMMSGTQGSNNMIIRTTTDLYEALLRNKEKTFEMFLKHCNNANDSGCVIFNNFISNINLAVMATDNPFYLKCLFKYGAVPESPRIMIDAICKPENVEKMALKALNNPSKNKVASNKPFLEEEQNMRLEEASRLPALVLAFRYNKTHQITDLLSYSSMESLAIAISCLLGKDTFGHRLIPLSKVAGIVYCADFNEREKITEDLLPENFSEEELDPVSIILFHKEVENEKQHLFRALIHHFKERCRENPRKAITMLENINKVKVGGFSEGIMAGVLLLCEIPKPTLMERQILMQQLLRLSIEFNKTGLTQLAYLACQNVINVAQFSKKLMDTAICQKALEILTRINNSVIPNAPNPPLLHASDAASNNVATGDPDNSNNHQTRNRKKK